MSTSSASTDVVPSYQDVTRLALASFLARYREPTLTAYQQDLAAFLLWFERYEVRVLQVPISSAESSPAIGAGTIPPDLATGSRRAGSKRAGQRSPGRDVGPALAGGSPLG